jgi:hypothetical protein
MGPWLMSLLVFITTRWSIVATDRAILLFKLFAGRDTDVLVARLPRNTRLGPISGRWGMISVDGTAMFVGRRFRADVELADELIGYHAAVEPSEAAPVPAIHRPPISLRGRGRRRDH